MLFAFQELIQHTGIKWWIISRRSFGGSNIVNFACESSLNGSTSWGITWPVINSLVRKSSWYEWTLSNKLNANKTENFNIVDSGYNLETLSWKHRILITLCYRRPGRQRPNYEVLKSYFCLNSYFILYLLGLIIPWNNWSFIDIILMISDIKT